MTPRFKDIIMPWIFKWEGKSYENDPDDPGGATKFGIDQRSHPDVDIKNLTEEQALEIYWNEFIRYACEYEKPPMDWVFFNACVNCGIGRANKLLKESGKNPSKFLDLQEDFYKIISDHNPNLKKFLKGWLARTSDLRKVALS
jgi:lysozyme family protein